jgi:flagellar hook-length control protein FliK
MASHVEVPTSVAAALATDAPRTVEPALLAADISAAVKLGGPGEPADLGTLSGVLDAATNDSTPTRVVTQPVFVSRVIADRAIGMHTGRRELRISLDPEHLGPLVVELKLENGALTARMFARTKAATDLLTKDSEKLQTMLKNLGFITTHVDVQHVDSDELFHN